MASIRNVAPWLLGMASLSTACVDALRLEPPTQIGTGGGGSVTTTGSGGEGGSGPIPCSSSLDCPEPTSLCDTVKHECAECLSLGDCSFRPGTVCSKGACVCADSLHYCGPNRCEDLTTSQQNCGKCDHGCFGLCVAGACADPWEPVGTLGSPPSARRNHVAVWSGTKMVVWGGTTASGQTATGGLYDPATYTWTPTTLVGAPLARERATVVWTGTEMLVWGGYSSQTGLLADGGRFNPAKNSWTPMSTSGSPAGREGHSAVWTGTEMIVWGGMSADNQLTSGARYNPTTDKWTPVTTLPPVVASRANHCGIWDSNKALMFLVGGFGDNVTQSVNDQYWGNGGVTAGVSYNPVGENWANLSDLVQPSARAFHTCVFDGQRTLVFGGYDGASELGTGASFDPASGWTTFGGNLPDARRDHTAVWLSAKKTMIVFGGQAAGTPLDSGAAYDAPANLWTGSLPRALSPRYGHTAVSTGDKMIVWGGTNSQSAWLADGGIYTP
jgi:N-acetylneuraminic acid mutarotase